MKPIEPFGYFRAEPFGWTNCAETDDGAVPLYYQADIDGLQSDNAALNLALRANKEMLVAETARADKAEQQRDELLKYLKWALPKIMRKPCEWCSEGDIDAHIAAIRLIDSMKGGA